MLVLVLVVPVLVGCTTDADSGDEPTPTPTAATAASGLPVLAVPLPTPTPLASPVPGATDPSISPDATPSGPPPLPAPLASPVAGAGPFAGPTADLGAVVWASSVEPTTQAPVVRVDRFAVDAPTIHATLPVGRLEAGATVQATWAFNGSPIDGRGATVVAPSRVTGTWLAFSLARGSSAWPDGTYTISVAVDGQPAIRADVVVGTPPEGA